MKLYFSYGPNLAQLLKVSLSKGKAAVSGHV